MKYILYILLFIPCIVASQEQIEGVILEGNEKNEYQGLDGANVFWLNTSIGTITDENGKFSIPYKNEYKKLVISYVGFETDTITVSEPKRIQHTLGPKGSLDEVIISTRKKASSRNTGTARSRTSRS